MQHFPLENMFDTLRMYDTIAHAALLLFLLPPLAAILWKRRAASSGRERSTADGVFGAPGS